MAELKLPIYPKRGMLDKKRICVPLDSTVLDTLNEVAWRNQVSVNYIAAIAIMKLLNAEAKGEFSFAEGYMGKPLPRA